ncbi:DUF6875 domain-containing protein [Pseudomonas sp. MYb118]|uniref:DUF6875 domain-containing protein n=1 Tax=Pseudomonas sp. MYb118 TaxID=1848720 RepID=UPI0034CFC051
MRVWSINEPVPTGLPEFVKTSFEGVSPYLRNFLTAQHPHRNGVMCPFMPKALADNNIHLTYFETQGTDKQLLELIRGCVAFYKQRTTPSFGAVIILLEEGFDIVRLLRVHIAAKPDCIREELMIGALYKDSQAPSLHANNYFPLRTPSPTLVLRDLTAQDLQFLTPGHYGLFSKLKFLNSFIGKFSGAHLKGYAKAKVSEAVILRRRYLLKLGIGGSLVILLASLCSVFWI